MFNWKVTEKVSTKASKEEIWAIWEDVQNWPMWDNDLEWSRIEGSFEEGAKGELKPKGWPVTSFLITNLSIENSFETETCMPFTKLVFDHQILEENGVNQIIHTATARGLLAPILKFTLGRKLQREFIHSLKQLAKLTEEKSETQKI